MLYDEIFEFSVIVILCQFIHLIVLVSISGLTALNDFLSTNILEINPQTHLLKCGLCEYTYNRRNNVARHIEAKHVVMQFQCDLCDKITPTRHAMYYHKKNKTMLHYINVKGVTSFLVEGGANNFKS